MPTGTPKNGINKGWFKKGQKLSEKTKKKMSLFFKGRKLLPFSEERRKNMSLAHKGKIPWNKGKHLSQKHKMSLKKSHIGNKPSEETKQKMRLAQKGEKHPRWKGGISTLNNKIRTSYEYRQWVSDVFTRDNFTCQKCNKRGGYLHAHHIKKFSKIIEEYQIKTMEQVLNCKELWNINNGQTLHKKCHIIFHHSRQKRVL
jgi:5-methylcytosine-specific restriction endonuclease McrA